VNERIFFDENETRMILDGHPFADLPVETRNKISQSGMEEYYNVLPRNIRLVIDKM
jgi:hypothetical protein